jgi:hypothetical protein
MIPAQAGETHIITEDGGVPVPDTMTPERQRREVHDDFAEAANNAAFLHIPEAELISVLRWAYAQQKDYEAAHPEVQS